jgi:hypothetical protein
VTQKRALRIWESVSIPGVSFGLRRGGYGREAGMEGREGREGGGLRGQGTWDRGRTYSSWGVEIVASWFAHCGSSFDYKKE